MKNAQTLSITSFRKCKKKKREKNPEKNENILGISKTNVSKMSNENNNRWINEI